MKMTNYEVYMTCAAFHYAESVVDLKDESGILNSFYGMLDLSVFKSRTGICSLMLN